MQRDHGLDFVKGCCVLAMAIHHSINYFPLPYLSVKYVHFVSGAFPFLAGFVVTHISGRKYDARETRKNLGLRLIFRGVRLLVLCGLLNALILVAGLSRSAFIGIAGSIGAIYLSHTGMHVAFDLLISIGYVLIALGVLCMVDMLRPVTVALIAMFLSGCCMWFYFSTQGGYYIIFFTIGLIGALFGFLSGEALTRVGRLKWPASIIYLSSLAAIIMFNQPFPIYVYSIIATLLALYTLATRLSLQGWYSKQLVLWGRYTLILYLAQILVLILLKHLLGGLALSFPGFLGACLITCAFQTPMCCALDRIRSRSESIDGAYRTIFA